MAYENLGTPSGNNLYITIPLRGTQNWDEKLKDGFFQKVVDHDHTPGKGARIVEAALDVAVRSKLDQVAVNTSEIAQNALDISQNAGNILQNGLDIASNDTDIAALDTRLTTAESGIASNDIEIATNGSEIAQNALDISQNAANILQNAIDIASNDTDIAALDTRLTTAESDKITATEAQNLIDAGGFLNTTEVTTLIQNTSPNNVIELNNATDIAAISGTTVKNAIVRVNTSTSISNVVFENCTMGIDQNGTFSGCTLTGCSVRESDNHPVPYSVTFNSSCNLWGVDIYGFNTCNIDSCSVSGLTVSNGSSVTIDSCTNLTKLNITCRALLIDNQATFSDSLITIFDYLKIDSGTADNQVSFEDSILSTPVLYSDVAYSILVDSDSRINVEDSYTTLVFGTGYYLKIVNDQGDTLIDKNVGNSALLHSPFKIREGQLVEEAENAVAVAAKISSTVYITTNPQILALDSAPIDTNNAFDTTNHYFVAPSAGVYAVSFQVEFIGSGFYSGWVFVKKTDSSGNNPVTISPEFPAMLPHNAATTKTYSRGEVLVELSQAERIEVYVKTPTTNGTIYIGTTDSVVNFKKIS
jgi:hypothetical protein